MKRLVCLVVAVAFALASAASSMEKAIAQSNSAKELAGLWEAKRRFGPDIRGTLLITQRADGWWAAIAGHTVQAKLAGGKITFELPDGRGSFKGILGAGRTKIVGHWIQFSTSTAGDMASPVTLAKYGHDAWRGNVRPYDDAMTCYLMVKPRDDGSVAAFLRNPERNIGFIQSQYPVDHIERVGEAVKLFAASKSPEKARVVAEGNYDAARQILSIYLRSRGGTYDFRHVAANERSDFYPRGLPSVPYVYRPPVALDDGWPTASLEDVGISRTSMEKFIQMIIDAPQDSVNALAIHGVLIARHGKLVLEEYFYGEHRENPHDTRSASKSLSSDLAGAAIYAGVPLSASSPVYQVMNGGTFPPGLEPQKRAITLEHLLTMSSGLDCDDEDEKSPGGEDNISTVDIYKSTMDLKMIRKPGEKAVYCAVNANLAVGVVSRAAKQHSLTLFQNLLAGPLQIKQYYLGLSEMGDVYGGGGARFLPRDFMKIGQLHINGGTWNGRRIFTPEWSRRSTSPITRFSDTSKARYGYLWWVYDYSYKGRTLHAFFASGNGGQEVIGIPELDLVIATYGGNYNDWDTGTKFLLEYVPKYILPAVDK